MLYQFNKHFCKRIFQKFQIEKLVFNVPFVNLKRNLSNDQSSFQKYLQSKIKMTGPITVAEYMKEALGNPMWVGYCY